MQIEKNRKIISKNIRKFPGYPDWTSGVAGVGGVAKHLYIWMHPHQPTGPMCGQISGCAPNSAGASRCLEAGAPNSAGAFTKNLRHSETFQRAAGSGNPRFGSGAVRFGSGPVRSGSGSGKNPDLFRNPNQTEPDRTGTEPPPNRTRGSPNQPPAGDTKIPGASPRTGRCAARY